MKKNYIGTIGYIKGNLMSNPNLLDKGYNNQNFYPGAPNIPNSAIETLSRILPSDIAGLCLCLDAEINSRKGVHDESINGMQNLVYAPIGGNANTVGCAEKLNGTPTFTNKGIKLGGTCFYPAYGLDDLTIEFCIKFGDSVLNNVHFIAHDRWGEQGYQLYKNGNTIRMQAGSDASPNKYVAVDIPEGTVHFAITTKLTQANNTKLFVDGNLRPFTATINTIDNASIVKTNTRPFGLGGTGNESMESVTPTTENAYPAGAFYAANDVFHSFRLWSRQLTPEEIKTNYQADKRRFG